MRYHVDGEIIPADEATVSVRNRGVLYGDGITEHTRAFGGQVFEWNAHERRIREKCGALSIPVPADLHERIVSLLAANDLADAVCRLSITRGGGPGLTPDVDAPPTVVIGVEPAPRGGRTRTGRPETTSENVSDGATRDGSDEGTEAAVGDETTVGDETAASGGGPRSDPAVVQTVTIRRLDGPDPLGERAADVRARLELARAATDEYRADEALVRDREGFVVGGAASDLLFVDEQALHVPRADPVDVLRPVVCALAREESIPVERGRYPPDAVRDVDEAFLASAVDGVRPIARLDGIAIGDGPVRKLLAATLGDLIEEQYY